MGSSFQTKWLKKRNMKLGRGYVAVRGLEDFVWNSEG